MTMKLGTQTGSFFNHMMSGAKALPDTEKGATILHWTDREAYFVISVSEDKKRCTIERPKVIRTDKLGMSDQQDYEYQKSENPIRHDLVFRYGGWWIDNKEKGAYGSRYEKVNIAFGFMREYYDFSF